MTRMTRRRILPLLGLLPGLALMSAHAYAADTMHNMEMGMNGMTGSAIAQTVPDESYEFTLPEIVVTGYRSESPLTIVTDPRRPRQPIPAADGGGYLKSIPGFSVVRKGGIGGDPMMRGMGGSRMVMQMDGMSMAGGCPNRMDPTATYAFLETYSRIIVNKGPQSVRYGASIAGSVIFERETERFEKPGVRGNVSLMGASNHRFDEIVDVTAGGKEGYARFIQTRNYSQDYKDGDGNRIHSGYGRHSLSGIIGLTPDVDTLFEVAYDSSRGWGKFAHGMMDGSKFDRDSWAVKFERAHMSPVVEKLTLNFNHADIDHLMDNYTFRKGMMGTDVKRRQYGVRVVADLKFSPRTTGAVGIELAQQEHAFARAMKNMPRAPFSTDMTIKNLGMFFEYSREMKERDRLKAGLRWDRTTDHYHPYMGRQSGTTTDNMMSGFIRWEHTAKSQPLTFYIGLGHAERPADYWEAYHTWNVHHNLSTRPKKERNTQLDLGWVYGGEKNSGSLSLFYSHVQDFILRRPANDYANVNARLYGFEADYTHSFSDAFSMNAALAYTRGDDRTNDAALPQIAPLEANLTAKYAHGKAEANAVWRLVARQNRFHTGYGSVTGTDSGATGGFGILSLSLAYRPDPNLTFSLGVDNLFNKTYSEFVNHTELADVAGFSPPSKAHINEPGRTVWFKTNYRF
ncbi:TonB-dependent copper receptor [Selenomonas sp. FOBRC9]|uniref:TonB-dependent copper receptor n=1 Tax=Selenomonas sp. FOBRC9 TaxID=936573 RepID=UPI00027A6936|nr:TonB-dependent copper receptor [Selenomonas sp. FOBRC9]EJP28832.1 TonB-dependent copper receptor [Selenomonas sp. FOBRC9]